MIVKIQQKILTYKNILDNPLIYQIIMIITLTHLNKISKKILLIKKQIKQELKSKI